MFDSYIVLFFFFKQKTAYEVRISDWSSDVCSSDLTAILGILRMDFKQIFAMPQDVRRVARLGTDVVLGKDAAGGKQQGILAGTALVAGHIFRDHETSLAAHEFVHMHDGRAIGRIGIAGRSEEHTSELPSLMRISYAVFCLKKKHQTY